MTFCHGALSVVCPSIICQNRYWDFNQHSEQPQTRSDHKRIVPAIQEYDTTVYLVIFACSNICKFLILELFTKFRIREFSFFFRSDIIIVIFARFWNSNFSSSRNSRKLKPREYYQIYIISEFKYT